jgi:hypothetical protein
MGSMEKRDKRNEGGKMINNIDRIEPSSNPEQKGDLPDEIDLWFGDVLEYEDLSEEGKRRVQLMTQEEKTSNE